MLTEYRAAETGSYSSINRFRGIFISTCVVAEGIRFTPRHVLLEHFSIRSKSCVDDATLEAHRAAIPLKGSVSGPIAIGVCVDSVPSDSIQKTPMVPEAGLRLNSSLPSLLTAISRLALFGGFDARIVDPIGVRAPLLAIENPEIFDVPELTPYTNFALGVMTFQHVAIPAVGTLCVMIAILPLG